ncbi:MAG: TRAP transporter large permease subunit, partial [Nannocystaceae bacterium]
MSKPRPWIEAFAPATVSNLGPGFDCLGLAVRTVGDRVRARRREAPGVDLLSIEGDDGKLPMEVDRNTAAVAASWLLQRYAPGQGVELQLLKGLPLGSGLGSSGASACAAAVAVDAALELSLPATALVEAARHAEGVACGTPHADNVAPCIVGGIATRLVEFSRVLVGPIRGGLAHVNVVASMLFGGTSGSAVADV